MQINYLPKQILTLVLISIGLVLTSCGEDDTEQVTTSDDPLIGTWTLTEDGNKDCPNPNEDYTDINSCPVTTSEGMCVTLTFNEDGTYAYDGFSEDGTYTISDDIITLCESDTDCDEHTLSIVGNNLTLTEVTEFDECIYYTKWSK